MREAVESAPALARSRRRMFWPRFWTVRHIAVVSVCVASIAILGAAGLYGVTTIGGNVASMYRSNTAPIEQLARVREAQQDIRRLAWKFIALRPLDRKPAYVHQLRAGLARFDTALAKYRAVEPSTRWEIENVGRFADDMSKLRAVLAKTVTLIDSGQYDAAASALTANIALLLNADSVLNAAMASNVEQSAQAVQASSLVASRVIWTSAAVFGALLCAGAVVTLHLIRQRNSASLDASYSAWLCDQVIEATPNGVLITDVNGTIVRVNPAFSQITGFGEAEVLGRNPSMWASGQQSPEFYRDMWRTLTETGRWKGEMWNLNKAGTQYLQSLTIAGIADRQGKFIHFSGIFTDITHQKENEKRLNYLAMHDGLTGLANRNLFKSRLDHAVARAARNARLAAVMFIDLDGFKAVNDTFGHSAGDALLIEISARLRRSLRETDTLARLGGDEFAVLLEDIADPAVVVKIAQVLRVKVGEPVLLDEDRAFVTPSIGISIYPSDGNSAAQLLDLADQAMYEAKRAGKNTIRLASEVAAPAVAAA